MNEFTEHYIATGYSGPFLKPTLEKLAEIWFDITDDISRSLEKWEKLGFIKLEPPGDHIVDLAAERSDLPRSAAAIGASLVIYKPWPSPPEPVYLAPKSLSARTLAWFEPRTGSVKLVLPDLSGLPSTQIGPITHHAARLQQAATHDLTTSVSHWQENGFVLLGTSDVVGKNDDMSLFDRLHMSALSAGASLVFVQITPAKVRSIKRHASGRIDMDAVLADMPSKAYPKGNSIIQVAFLAPVSFRAQASAELKEYTTVIYVYPDTEIP
ncbi:hypothetical protein FHW58_001779 [Duganella sp. 1224]|uniref:hypothetical protein n=1 Tax=Duganella sp. 1224 TaxID=2587052 RepID=UPI0015CD659B|nr:hypothetical protein [Duganella sp. 1224]NYE60627.1 hypothetical protein [Duganella sp. 1224]